MRSRTNEVSYIVAPRAAAGAAAEEAFRALLDEVRGGAGRVVSLSGLPDAPTRAVIAVPGASAEALRTRYAGTLIIEPDRPLSIQ